MPTEEYFSIIREQLSVNGQAFIRITGVSMQPLLHHLRDGVIIIAPDKIRTGDIVLFDRMNGRYALHRVIHKGKNGFTMAGDNQWHMEKALSYDQIVGVVCEIERNGRRISCDRFDIRFYSLLVAAFDYPRIYIRKILSKIKRTFSHKEIRLQEEV